jgi:Zn ribbon nucleic-acid-binding protein
MTDYDRWLSRIRAAIEKAGNKRAVARWLTNRLGSQLKSTEVKLHRMLAGTQVPQADFSTTLDAWVEEGCPVPKAIPSSKDGRRHVPDSIKKKRAAAGGKAKAARSK